MSTSADILVVGGGPAGAAAAADLAAKGRGVILCEREAGPHDKVCGEFLSRETALYLQALGLDLPALGARRIHSVRLAKGAREASVALPFPAFSLSRRRLDDALLARAAALGADVRMGAKVQSVIRTDAGWEARLQDETHIAAPELFLATGKHDLRGWGRPPERQTDFIGFKTYWDLAAGETRALDGHVELALFRGGYAGLQRIEGERANLCLVVRRGRLAELGGSWDALLDAIRVECALLGRRLAGATHRPVAADRRPLAIAGIPYGYVRRMSDGPWYLGDQAAVIPSFSGDGMAIALHSARLAAEASRAGEGAGVYQRRLAADVGSPVRLAALVSRISVHPLGQAAIGRALGLLPSAMAGIAAATRVPPAALRRAGLVDPG